METELSEHYADAMRLSRDLMAAMLAPNIDDGQFGGDVAALWTQPGVTPRFQELELTYKQIRANPETHDQAVYRRRDEVCGTAMCFAGHYLTVAGVDNWLAPPAAGNWQSDYLLAEPGEEGASLIAELGEPSHDRRLVVHAGNRARTHARITNAFATALFAGDNDLEEIRRLLDALRELHGLEPVGYDEVAA